LICKARAEQSPDSIAATALAGRDSPFIDSNQIGLRQYDHEPLRLLSLATGRSIWSLFDHSREPCTLSVVKIHLYVSESNFAVNTSGVSNGHLEDGPSARPGREIAQMMLTAEQVRAARAMLRMEQTQLAEKSGVSVETVKRLEGALGPLKAQHQTLKNIRTALEFAGVEFVDDEKKPGVRLAEDRTEAFVKAMTEEITGLVRSSLQVTLQKNPAVVQGPKRQLIKTVLDSVEAILNHTLPKRLPGKDIAA
jgi:transcriptional regulator with XRE-family HTH domain